MEADERAARRLLVSGRVQGVFFRASTRDAATRHGVTGWVRNTADGRVEAWLEGSPPDVDAVEAWMRDGGPPSAWVTEVAVTDEAPVGHRAFEVR